MLSIAENDGDIWEGGGDIGEGGGDIGEGGGDIGEGVENIRGRGGEHRGGDIHSISVMFFFV